MLEPLYYIEDIHSVRNTVLYPRNKYQRIYRLDYFLVEKFSTYYGSNKNMTCDFLHLLAKCARNYSRFINDFLQLI